MKAILVVDLGNADSDFYFIDYVVRNKETGNALESGYNVNLKPMPQKKEIDVKKIEDIMHIEFQFTDVIRDKYIADIKLDTDKLIAIGYNRCIDEIIGAEDEE